MTRTIDTPKTDCDEQNWQDTGCEFADHCLGCARAVEDCPAHNGRVMQQYRMERQKAMVRARRNDGWSIEEICQDLKISESTVIRALRQG